MKRLIKIWQWFDDRTGLSVMIKPVADHLVPRGTTWIYVFGSATLVAFVIQVVTGIALATMYIPSTAQAYQSLRFITYHAWLGNFIRGLHYFGASAMILLIGIHMIRVFLTAAYKFPREMNWISGVVLLGLTVLMGFTGQLLRWDQNALWSVVVGAEQAGRIPFIGDWISRFLLAGKVIGGATLSRFFAFHVFFIPALIFSVVGLHLYLVIRNGISEPPKQGQAIDPKTYRGWYESLIKREGYPFWPDAIWRDIVFGVGVIAVVMFLAYIVGPPAIGKPPNPTNIQATPRPDWYLLWYFAVLALIPSAMENYVIVLFPLFVGLVFFLLPLLFNKGERHPFRRPWSMGAVILIVMMVGTLWIAGVKAHWSPDFTAKPLSEKVIGASSGPVFEGAQVFHQRGCINCHNISGDGGHRGPDLTTVADRMTVDEMTIRILKGAGRMPAFGGILTPEELDNVVAFLKTRKSH
jgi:ubiquinol-cytochrome c reductase cytochrome b subunit